MKKKILIIAVLLIAVLSLVAMTNTVKAEVSCTNEKCGGGEKCTGCKEGTCDEKCCPVKIGDKCYPTIQAAIDAEDSNGATIELLRDANGNGFKVENSKNIIIDFGGHTYTIDGDLVGSNGKQTLGCQLKSGSTVTLKNGTLASSKAKMLVQNYSNLTVEDMTLSATMDPSDGLPYALSINSGKVDIIGNTSITSTAVAFDTYYMNGYPNGAQVMVNTTGTISGEIEVKADSGKESSSQSTLTIENINHNGHFDVDTKLSEKLTIEDGTYTESVAEYVKNGSAVAIKTGNTTKYYVGNDAVEAVNNAEVGSHVTVEKGTLEIANLPSGVTFDGAVTVTNPSSSGDTVETIKSNLQALIAKAEGEENATEGLTNAINTAKAVLANAGATYGELQQALANLQSAYDNFNGGNVNENQGIVSGNESNEAGDNDKLDEEPKMGETIVVPAMCMASIIIAMIVVRKRNV